MDLINKNFQQDISELLDSARKQAKTAVNLSMVYAYYEIGRRIYEEEQQGKERADYGKYLLKELSEYLLTVSYTHLDVYKRQPHSREQSGFPVQFSKWLNR